MNICHIEDKSAQNSRSPLPNSSFRSMHPYSLPCRDCQAWMVPAVPRKPVRAAGGEERDVLGVLDRGGVGGCDDHPVPNGHISVLSLHHAPGAAGVSPPTTLATAVTCPKSESSVFFCSLGNRTNSFSSVHLSLKPVLSPATSLRRK